MAAIPPGDPEVFKLAVELGRHSSPMTPEERSQLLAKVKGVTPIFRNGYQRVPGGGMAATAGLAVILAMMLASAARGATTVGMIETVCGPLAPEKLGRVLTHEHVLVDFIGADQVSPDRYDRDEVFAVMLPHLKAVKAAGIDTLIECTPNYLGRDPALLRRLSLASGLHLVTNTGLYKDPYLPAWAREASAEEIAPRWIAEATAGIGPEGIKPGFIKIAVNEGPLSDVQRKIVRAAALTSKATGLAIASHTTQGVSAHETLDLLAESGVPASRFIWVHADAEPDAALRFRAAERGAWLSYDGIREGNATQKVPLVLEALSRCPDRLLISQDAGWYHVGEPRGGEIAPLDWLPREFVPLLRTGGATEAQTEQLLVRNPARAFVVRDGKD